MTNRGTTSSSKRFDECSKDFIKNWIESNNFGFYEPIIKNKLRNFDTAITTKIMKGYGKDIAIKNDRETFARLLVIQRTRETDIKEVLRHELSSEPLALSNPDTASTLCKTAKNELFKFLRFHLEPYQSFQWTHLKFMMGWFCFRNYQLLCPRLAIFLISW